MLALPKRRVDQIFNLMSGTNRAMPVPVLVKQDTSAPIYMQPYLRTVNLNHLSLKNETPNRMKFLLILCTAEFAIQTFIKLETSGETLSIRASQVTKLLVKL